MYKTNVEQLSQNLRRLVFTPFIHWLIQTIPCIMELKPPATARQAFTPVSDNSPGVFTIVP